MGYLIANYEHTAYVPPPPNEPLLILSTLNCFSNNFFLSKIAQKQKKNAFIRTKIQKYWSKMSHHATKHLENKGAV